MKSYCLTSCDEASDVDLAAKAHSQAFNAPLKQEGRNSVQVEVRSITETKAINKHGATSECAAAKLCIEEVPVSAGSWVAQQRLRRSQDQETALVSAEEL